MSPPDAAVVQQCLTRGRDLGVVFEQLHGQYSLIEAQLQQNGFLPEADILRKQQIEQEASRTKAQMAALEAEIKATPGLAEAVQAAFSGQTGPAAATVAPFGAAQSGPQLPVAPVTAGTVGPSGIPLDAAETVKIACCKCGVPTEPNEMRVCVNCIQVDITEGIPRICPIKQCPACKRYLGDQHMWLTCEWESNTLMALCLKKLPMKRVRLVDAKFVYTEMHSRRIKVNFAVEKEVIKNCNMRQEVLTEFIVQAYQCPDCTKSVTPHLWVAQVQVRQRTAEHKRTMLFLEQLVLKDNAHSKCTNIVDKPDGLDFCFSRENDAKEFVAWIKGYFGIKSQEKSSQLISADIKNNTAHNKIVYLCELPPVCRDDLVFLPKKQATSLGGCSQFMLCRKVGRSIGFIDPYSLRGIDIDHVKFWKNPVKSIMSRRDLLKFVVLNIEPVDLRDIKTAATAGRFLQSMVGSTIGGGHTTKGGGDDHMVTDAGFTQATLARRGVKQYKCVDVEICRCEELGVTDSRQVVRSHLGYLLNVGDIVLGYDLTRQNVMEDDADFGKALDRLAYSVILVRKEATAKQRSWVMKTLPKAESDNKRIANSDNTEAVELFKDDVEQDREMQANVNIYRNPKMPKGTRDMTNLVTMLQDLTVDENQTLESFL